jgi:hypothetical protein
MGRAWVRKSRKRKSLDFTVIKVDGPPKRKDQANNRERNFNRTIVHESSRRDRKFLEFYIQDLYDRGIQKSKDFRSAMYFCTLIGKRKNCHCTRKYVDELAMMLECVSTYKCQYRKQSYFNMIEDLSSNPSTPCYCRVPHRSLNKQVK